MTGAGSIYWVLNSVGAWLVKPFKLRTVGNALSSAAQIISLPLFLVLPGKKMPTAAVFTGPAQRPQAVVGSMNKVFEPKPDQTVDGGENGVAKASLVNATPGLKSTIAPVGKIDSTGSADLLDSTESTSLPNFKEFTPLPTVTGSTSLLDYPEILDFLESTEILDFLEFTGSTDPPDGAESTNPYVDLQSRQVAIEVSQAEYERIKRELRFEDGKVHIAVIGGTGVGKSSLVNAFRGLKHSADGAAPVGEIDCTKSVNRYVDTRFPWIVWFDVPGAGTQERPTTRYFDEQGLFVMDFVLVVCSNRVIDRDMVILKRAHHYGIPAALVRSKADQDLRQRVERECENSGDEDEIKSKMKGVKQGYIKEIKEDLMKQVVKAGLKEYVTRENCFLVSAKVVRGLMTSTKELPAPRGLDQDSYQNTLAEIKAAMQKHFENVFSKADDIDERNLLEMVFHSVAQRRYNTGMTVPSNPVIR